MPKQIETGAACRDGGKRNVYVYTVYNTEEEKEEEQ